MSEKNEASSEHTGWAPEALLLSDLVLEGALRARTARDTASISLERPGSALFAAHARRPRRETAHTALNAENTTYNAS